MKIQFMSQRHAESITPQDNIFLISICDPNRTAYLNRWNSDNVLKLNFEDLDPVELESINRKDLIKSATFFSDDDAQKIKQAIKNLPDNIDTIYVHCKMGRSRSAAVAKYLSEYFNSPVDFSNANVNNFIYNKLSNSLKPLTACTKKEIKTLKSMF